MKHGCGAMKKGTPKTKMFLTQNKDDGNKMCTMGTKVHWHDDDVKCESL